MRARSAYAAAATALAAFGAFEAWNHETEAWPLAAGALAPALLPAAAARSSVPPFWLGIAGFFAPQGHRLQVAALGWSAHVFARRALG